SRLHHCFHFSRRFEAPISSILQYSQHEIWSNLAIFPSKFTLLEFKSIVSGLSLLLQISYSLNSFTIIFFILYSTSDNFLATCTVIIEPSAYLLSVASGVQR
ncbi:hypothetical protein SERLA73DRAFT_183853, partial [Serpula lacrymans var. lacrymans S7.3]